MGLLTRAKPGATSLSLSNVRKGTEGLSDLAEPTPGGSRAAVPQPPALFSSSMTLHFYHADDKQSFGLLLCSLGV